MDDAAAVFRTSMARKSFVLGLAASATCQTLAVVGASDNGRRSSLYLIDPKLLRAGENLLAVEVHQESPTRVDLRCGCQPQCLLAAVATAEGSVVRRHAVRVLQRAAAVGAARRGPRNYLKELAADANPVLRVDALMALHAVSPQSDGSAEIPAAKDEPEIAYREQVSGSTNEALWADRAVGRSQQDRAGPSGPCCWKGAHQLVPKNGPLCNTLAVAQYRVGQYEKSLRPGRVVHLAAGGVAHGFRHLWPCRRGNWVSSPMKLPRPGPSSRS